MRVRVGCSGLVRVGVVLGIDLRVGEELGVGIGVEVMVWLWVGCGRDKGRFRGEYRGRSWLMGRVMSKRTFSYE